jgi:hypothetical protein
MATAVYVLCAALSLLCTVLLVRGFVRSRSRLLLWSALCFVFLAINNILLVVDLSIVPDTDLAIVRTATGLAGPVVLLYGFIFDMGRGERR